MAKITIKDTINAAIEAQYERTENRGYLGVSQLGHPCLRYLYYVLHDAHNNKVYPRTKRIWSRGDWEEDRIVKDLESIGCSVYGQQKTVRLFAPHVVGHIDGIVIGVPGAEKTEHLLEIKTMNEASWKKYANKGVKESNHNYWVQAQLYAHLLGLSRILFVAVNKNTEQRHFERIKAEDIADEYENKAITVLGAMWPPQRIGGPDWWECKWCPMQDICHHSEPVNKSCRSCTKVRFTQEGIACGLDKDTVLCDEWQSCVNDPA